MFAPRKRIKYPECTKGNIQKTNRNEKRHHLRASPDGLDSRIIEKTLSNDRYEESDLFGTNSLLIREHSSTGF